MTSGVVGGGGGDDGRVHSETPSQASPNLIPPPPPPTSPPSKYSPQTPPPKSSSSRNATNASFATAIQSPRPTSPSGSSVCTSKSGISNSPRPPVYRRGVGSSSPATSAAAAAAAAVTGTTTPTTNTAPLLGKSSIIGLSRSNSNSSIPRSIQGNNITTAASATTPSSSTLEQEVTTTFDNSTTSTAPTPLLNDEFTALNADNFVINSSNSIQPDPHNPHHRKHLPSPLPPSQCPLLCVFYAEFDIVIGPRVCYQSPHKFMQLDVDVNIEEIHQALEETFLAVLPKDEEEVRDEKMQTEGIETGNDSGADGSPTTSHPSIQHQHDHDEYWKWSSNMKRPPVIERDVSDASTSRSSSSMIFGSRQNVAASASNAAATSSSPIQEVDGKSKRSAGIKSGSTIMSENIATPTTTTSKPVHERKQSDSSTTVHSSSHSRNPSYASASKGAASNPNQQTLSSEVGGDTSTIDTELLQNSIFAATSEYIITGNELANRSITVSTHDMHILSRPQIICDTQRYERNSLLFAVGFVLRRGDNVEPCHFWPVLSKLSSTLYDMEVESEFLSNGRTRPQIQIILEDILISLNSSQMECHLLLDNANLMNLQLYHPPPSQAATPPVPDYAVPLLLRPEWQLQMYDWDLTINWIVPHIDGCQYVKQIAASTEVDMEMVRACLRVLRHHGVLTYVDVFRYSNLYEFQGYERLHTSDGVDEKKSKKTDAVKKVLTEAFWYAAKSKYVTRSQPMTNTAPSFGNTPVTPWASSKRTNNVSDEISPLPRSFPSLMGHFPMRKEHPPDVDDDDTARSDRLVRCPDRKEIAKMTNALEQMYCSFCRDKSFGDVLLEKVGSMTDPSSSESKKCHDVSSCDENNIPAQCDDNNDNDRGIDWNHVFDYFDHRRLVTFGLFRGLIRRVHQYPLACAIKIENQESSMSDAVREGKEKDFDCDTDNMAGFELSAVAKEAASIAGGLTMEERSLATSCSASPLQSTSAAVSFSGRTDISVSKAAQKEVYLRSRGLLMARVAHAMDGTRCDDELSCMFDAPIEHLTEMLEDTGRWNVISVYSCVE